MKVPDEWPDEFFDLIVLSEVLYFLSPKDVVAVADRVCSSSDLTGLVLLVNWRGVRGSLHGRRAAPVQQADLLAIGLGPGPADASRRARSGRLPRATCASGVTQSRQQAQIRVIDVPDL